MPIFSDNPKFQVEPSDVQISAGQTAAFECRGQNEWSEINWLKDDQPLQLDHRMKILPSGLLEITDVKISDLGSYKCSLENLRQSREAKLKLDGGE